MGGNTLRTILKLWAEEPGTAISHTDPHAAFPLGGVPLATEMDSTAQSPQSQSFAIQIFRPNCLGQDG